MPLLNLEKLIINHRYDVRQCLAQGSYAEIYEAYDLERGQPVIIKALNTHLRGAPDAEIEDKLVANFKQEAALMESLRHANIVRSFEQGAAEDRKGKVFLYLTLEYLGGGNLHDYCRQWPLTLTEAIRRFGPVCEALSVIHSRGIIHRDIKPGNLLFDGNRDHLKITDFGVAKMLTDGARDVTRVGTDLYSPPEHHPNLDGTQEMLTPAADIYSLAKTIYTALTGQLPNEFRRKPIDRLPPELTTEPWSARLLAVLRRATAHRVGDRYVSATEFWRDFAAVAEPEPDRNVAEPWVNRSDASVEQDETTHPRRQQAQPQQDETTHPRKQQVQPKQDETTHPRRRQVQPPDVIQTGGEVRSTNIIKAIGQAISDSLRNSARLFARRRIEIDLSRPSGQSASQPASDAGSNRAALPPIKPWLAAAALLVAVGLTLALQSVFAIFLPEPFNSLVAVLVGAGLATLAAILVASRWSRTVAAEQTIQQSGQPPVQQPIQQPIQQPVQQPALPSLPQFEFDVVMVDAEGRIRQSRRGRARQFVERLDDRVGLEMVEIPGGKFLMGSPNSEYGHTEHEEPRHPVRVSPFFLGKLPITQSQWRIVARWPKVNCDLNPDPSSFAGDDLPVENVSWRDAAEFCERLSRRTGRLYRLPSEAEWEYACRAGSDTPYHFGQTMAPGLANYDYDMPYGAGPRGVGRQQTSPAGGFGVANNFGLFDLHGNVWEWCADAWHHDYSGAPADGGEWRGGDEGLRVVRGGAWFNAARICRSAYRYWAPPDTRGHNCGFRVALVMNPASSG